MFGSINKNNTQNQSELGAQISDKTTRFLKTVSRDEMVLPSDRAMELVRKDEVARNMLKQRMFKNINKKLEQEEIENNRVDEWKEAKIPIFSENTNVVQPCKEVENTSDLESWLDHPLLNESDDLEQHRREVIKTLRKNKLIRPRCDKCHREYTKRCYYCMGKAKTGRQALKHKCNRQIPLYKETKLIYSQILQKKRQLIQSALLQGSDIYWTIEGKVYRDPEIVAKFEFNGFRTHVHETLRGGMMEGGKDDVDEKVNGSLVVKNGNIPDNIEDDVQVVVFQDERVPDLIICENPNYKPQLPPKDKIDPNFMESVKRMRASRKVRTEQMKVYLQPNQTNINGLNVEGSRNREKPVNFQEGMSKRFRVKTKMYAQHQAKREKQQQPIHKERGPNGTMYAASAPLYEGDPAFRLNKKSTPFEDQMQYTRHCQTLQQIQVVCLDPIVGTMMLPMPAPSLFNICTEWSDSIVRMWIPTIREEYDHTYDYAIRRLENQLIAIAIPYLGHYLIAVYPNQMKATGENLSIFSQYEFDSRESIFDVPETPVTILRDQLKTIVSVPQYLIQYAERWLGGKNMTNYTISSYMTDFRKWWPKTANRMFDAPTSSQILAALFHSSRQKQVSLFEHLGVNFDVLNLQHDNTKLLVELPKHRTFWSFVKSICTWILPGNMIEMSRELADNARFMGFNESIWQPLKKIFDDKVFILFGNRPEMKAFKWMNDKAAIVLEELLKLIPGVGLILTIKEILDEWKEGTITVSNALARILFHNWHELLPFWAKLVLLPARLLLHHMWNKPQNMLTANYHYTKRETSVSEFLIVNHDPTYPRFPQSEKVDMPKLPKQLKETLTTMMENVVEDNRNPVHVACTIASVQGAGVKNGQNLGSAYLKRNIQDKPLPSISDQTWGELNQTSQEWKPKFDIQYVSPQSWIDSPNHGSKKAMYQKAYDKFLIDSEIDYQSTLQLKTDEITMKPMMRTICAFQNSYVVNAAPVVASISNSMKQTFDGYTNLSPSQDYTLHILYATGMQTEQMCKIIKANLDLTGGPVPHWFLAVLGDDSALTKGGKVLCCDFSRYDSTQHTSQHEIFRAMFTTPFNREQINMLRTAANGVTKLTDPDTGVRHKVPINGLKTGCVETSVSNTTLTALSIATALKIALKNKLDPWTFIPKYLKDNCGFLPKANMQHVDTGFEFLKTIFILQNQNIVALPLLSCLAKIGKFLTPPKLIVPMSKIKTPQQICLDATYMQLKGKGNMENIPGFSTWYKALARKTSPFLIPYREKQYGAPILNDKVPVLTVTIEKAYQHRYDLSWPTVQSFFEQMGEVSVDSYPFTYSSSVIQKALEVDYGLEDEE